MGRAIGTGLHFVEINSATNAVTTAVFAIPDHAVISGSFGFVYQGTHVLPLHIVNIKANLGRSMQAVFDRSFRVKGIGVVGINRSYNRHRIHGLRIGCYKTFEDADIVYSPAWIGEFDRRRLIYQAKAHIHGLAAISIEGYVLGVPIVLLPAISPYGRPGGIICR